MRLAYVTSGSPVNAVWPRLADEQFVIGSQQVNFEFGGRIFSCRAPVGDFDLAALIGDLPEAQRPDVVACVVDGRTNSWARNVAACGASSVLLVGDSESAVGGLARIIDYARAEKFDRIVLTGAGADEPVFRALVGANVFWFPGLLCPVRDSSLPIIRQSAREGVLFAAPVENRGFQAHRTNLEMLARAGVPTHAWSDSSELRIEEFGDSAVALISSEQGEWPPELFEALAAGTAVVATGLSPADIARLWPEGAALCAVPDAQAAKEKARQFLAEVERAGELPVGRRAMRWYDEFLSEDSRRVAFWQLVREGRGPVAPMADDALPVSAFQATVARSAGWHLAMELAERPALWWSEADEANGACAIARFPRFRRGERENDAQVRLGTVSVGSPSVPVVFVADDQALPNGYEYCPASTVSAVRCDVSARLRSRREMWLAWERGDAQGLFELAKTYTSRYAGDLDGVLGLMEAFVEAGGANSGLEKCVAIANRIGAHDPRYTALLARQRGSLKRTVENRVRHAWAFYSAGDIGAARGALSSLADKRISTVGALLLTAHLEEVAGDSPAAAEAWAKAARHHPNDDRLCFNAAIALWRAGRKAEAGRAFWRAADHAPDEPDFATAFDFVQRADSAVPPRGGRARNLVVTGSENCQKHGAGVLVKRFFGTHRDTVTLRPATYYDGVEEAGAVHLCVPFRDISPRRLQTRLRRLLAPYDVERIMCVPFHREECLYAIAAHEIFSARLCTYVMDDRNVLIPDTDDAVMSDLFARSALRLAISSELQMAYTIKYDHDFDVMPPVVVDRSARRKNRWSPKTRPAAHVALVGSIWTEQQLNQLLRFVVRADITVDWFGRQASADLNAAGVNAMGFVSEQELADRLVDYPLVLVPSGMLDGTENNEWLTRLSLPSRICFLLQTQTPCLVLGSKDTCASRHVLHLGIGRVIPYDFPQPQQVIAQITEAAERNQILAAAERAADGFVMPEAGEWIWKSTDAGTAQPAPFHEFMDQVPELNVIWPLAEAGPIRISHFEEARLAAST